LNLQVQPDNAGANIADLPDLSDASKGKIRDLKDKLKMKMDQFPSDKRKVISFVHSFVSSSYPTGTDPFSFAIYKIFGTNGCPFLLSLG
jgi:hypothetical protein